MTKCYFCYSASTDSYWDYYCDNCIKIKQFCKLIGSEKLCRSLQFKINDEKLKKLTDKELGTTDIEDIVPEKVKPRHKGVKGLDPEVEECEKEKIVKSGLQTPKRSLRSSPKSQ